MDKRVCLVCKEEKSMALFRKHRRVCRVCDNKDKNERRKAQRRLKWKTISITCKRCGKARSKSDFCYGKSAKNIWCIDCYNETKDLEKRCTRCGKVKTYPSFGNEGAKKRSMCKECTNGYHKELKRKRGLKEHKELIGYQDREIPSDIDLTQTKICTTCNKEKQLKDFYYIYTKRCFEWRCKECSKARSKQIELDKIERGLL